MKADWTQAKRNFFNQRVKAEMKMEEWKVSVFEKIEEETSN